MIGLSKAISGRWKERMPSGLPLFDDDGAPNGTPLPYAEFSLPAGSPEYAFSGLSSETVLVHFDIYAAGRVEGWNYFAALTAAFDDCKLSVAGYEFLKMERETWHRAYEKGAWRYLVPYVVQLQPL